MTTHEAGTMFSLAVYAVISAGLLLWLLIRWARDRWVAAGRKAEALAGLSTPATEAEHAAGPLTFTCPLCQPWGHPPCTCVQDCRHGECRGGSHTTLSGLTRADVEYLRFVSAGMQAQPPPRRRGRRGRKAGTR
jgi:hypothetical protein